MKLRWVIVLLFIFADWVVLAAVMINSSRISRREEGRGETDTSD